MQLEELETAATEERSGRRRGAGHDERCARSRAASRCAPRCRRICRASGSSSRRRRACPCCGGKLAKLGETITETLEVIPRTWKVIQTVREKFSCRACETITQPPAPFHPIARGRAGPDLLAMILHGKFGNHQPLNRQSESFAREGIDLDVSTLADWVGACTRALAPLVDADPRARAGGRAHSWRRHDSAGAGQRQDHHRPVMDLCAR